METDGNCFGAANIETSILNCNKLLTQGKVFWKTFFQGFGVFFLRGESIWGILQKQFLKRGDLTLEN